MAEKKANLRIIIYGAGAVGGVVGGLLTLAGTPVVLIGRPGNVNAIRKHGLRVVTPSGIHIIRLPTVTSPELIDFGPADVVFLCVKSQDTEGVVLDLYSLVKDVPIFCLQNGVRNEEIVSNYYNRVYGVSIVGGGIFVHDGEVISRDDPPARLLVGCYPEGTDELVESVAANLRNAGYEVVVTPEVMPYKWGKLIINLTNAIGAITNTAGDETKIIASAVQKEAEEILAQAEIRCIATKEPSIRRQVSIIEPSKDPFGMSLGSTWQSLIRRQGSVETEFLNGEIVRQAKKLGKQAPINEMLLHITNEMAMNHESPGKYTPAELAKILKLN